MNIFKPVIKSLLIVSPLYALSAWSACLDSGVQLQILGSGGPGASDGRASSGYLLWEDGVSRILIDTGSGIKDQFHRAGANLANIDLIALSHFHPDHSSEFPALLWPTGGSFNVSGPTAAGVYPSLDDFLYNMFGPGGTFNILENRLELETIVVDTVADEPVDIWNEGNLTVRGTGVPHADTPTIAYRIDFGDTSIAFASDQNGSDPEFINFIQDVDFLVIHMTVNEDIAGMAADLHAKPSVWGQMASAAAVGHVVVSHIPNRAQLEQNLNVFSNNYTGEYTISDDLMCIELI